MSVRLYADQLFSVIENQVEKNHASDGRFMIGDIGKEDAYLLFTRCNNLADNKGLKLRFWLAECYCILWGGGDMGDLNGHFAKGNLTQYRNEVEPNTILVLVGTTHVTDSGSLADFFRCDGDELWKGAMKSSFSGWIKRLGDEVGLHNVSDGVIKKLNDVFKYLRESFGLSKVSNFLTKFIADNQDSCDTSDALLDLVLANLGEFSLPNMAGFAKAKGKNKTFRYYANGAADFFNYNLFIDQNNRKKYLKAVEAFAQNEEALQAFVFSPFSNAEEYLDSLRSYIESGDRNDADNFRNVDFTKLYDVVLKAKAPSSPSKDSLRKLEGSPAEVALTAIWESIGDSLADDETQTLSSISLRGVKFVHDMDRGSLEIDIKEAAIEYLRKLLGGLDYMLAENIGIPTENGQYVPIDSQLLNDEIVTSVTKSGEPYFEFKVCVNGGNDKRFAIRLPSDHSYRQLINLFHCAKDFLEQGSAPCKLPVFHLQYYKELMLARDAEEVRRVLSHCITACDSPDKFGTVIMTGDWWNDASSTPIKPYLQNLVQTYKGFVDQVCENGIYNALKLGQKLQVVDCYTKCATAYTDVDPNLADSHKLAAMLMRSYLVVDHSFDENVNRWNVLPYESSAIVTALHPAMIEMMQAQLVFQFNAFSRLVAKELKLGGSTAFKREHWTYYLDMAEMKMPLTGLQINQAGCFVVSAVGDSLVHRIGGVKAGDALASTRFLTRYDRVEEDEISDTDLFRVSSESRHLLRVLQEYYNIHLGAGDGITLAVYRNEDVQPVLAAVNQFVKWVQDSKHNDLAVSVENRPVKYAINVEFFSESSDTSQVANFLSQWQEIINEAEENGGDYAKVNFSISHQVVRTDDGYKQFAKTIEDDVDADIFVLYNFIKPDVDGCKFQAAEPFDVTTAEIKFPILEQTQCVGQTVDVEAKRSQIVSNRQFRISGTHADVSYRIKNESKQGESHIVLATGDFDPWKNVLDKAHHSAEWVVCVDALIDKKLLALGTKDALNKRELIGFGSGVGLHGEHNYTISTQKYTLETIRKRLLASMEGVYQDGFGFGQGTQKQFETIADCLLNESKELAGISLIRSLGPSEYIRDFMAYSLMHRIIPLDENKHLCDRIFSVDAYRHWFDQASDDDKTHPDLLWLRADYKDDKDAEGKKSYKLHITAKLIECKMAKENEAYVEKAIAQIENGLKVLADVFRPTGSESIWDLGFGEGDRPDMRYWCLQLHRMIAGSVNISSSKELAKFLTAMERLAAGDFEIEWGGGIFTFWTDSVKEDLSLVETCPVQIGESKSFDVPVFECGSKFVYRLCANETAPKLEWGKTLELAPVVDDDMPLRDPQPEIQEDESEIPFIPIAEDDPNGALPTEENGTGTSNTDSNTSGVPAAQTTTLEPISSQTATNSSQVIQPSAPAVVAQTTQTAQGIPARILLGKDVKTGKDVFWEFGHPKLSNRHFLIFGNSGMGKTYAIQTILCELGSKGQNSLIIDYTKGFLPDQLKDTTNKVLNPTQNYVIEDKLPMNPFKKQCLTIGTKKIEQGNREVAKRIASIFKTVYDLGDQQISVLIDSVKDGLDEYGESMTLDNIIDVLNDYLTDDEHKKSTVQTVISKLKPFIEEEPFKNDSSFSWGDLFGDVVNRCPIFQLVMLDEETQRLLTEFILWDLWAYSSNSGAEQNPHVIVLDEVQNLDQRLEAPLGKYLTEGRKFGLCIMAATQTLSNLAKDEQARLFMAGHKLFFRPSDPEMDHYAKFVAQAAGGTTEHWKEVLSSLSKGECISIGPAFNDITGQAKTLACKIKITSLEERGFTYAKA